MFVSKIKEITLLQIVGIKNIFKDKIKPRKAIARLASRFDRDRVGSNSEKSVKIETKTASDNLVAKSPSFQENKTSKPELEQNIEIAKFPSKKNKISKAIATLTSRFKKDKTTENKPQSQPNNLAAKLPNLSQEETKKKELERDIEKVDRTLIEKNIPHKKIVAIFRRIATNVKPENVDKIVAKLPKMNRGAVKEVWTQVQSLLATIGDPNTAWKSKTLAIAALIYLVSPIDAIPDVIPGIGLTDDVALIVAVVSSLAYELGNYVEKSADKGVEIASELADIQVKKYNKIVRLGLIGSILAGIIAILVQFIIKQMA
ncbi:MAG: YkvA family protein [Prochloraceae cyanobacterium]